MPLASQQVRLRPDIAEALAWGRPVVALESTLFVHGFPKPDNLALACELEAIVREEGAVPATIGVVRGAPIIGLSTDEIEHLATADHVPKVSVRDLAVAMAQGCDGATTVASTALLAGRAGIRLFATGGLGGVHREARETWDESADLVAISRAPIAVVCSGVKSILDVGATLERLESLSVGVIGFRTQRFPGFYLADSGYELDWAVDSAAAAAEVVRTHIGIGLGESGLVIANPLRAEDQLDPAEHDRVLTAALAEARRQGVRGKHVTPFLLEFFRAETRGASLEANLKLVRNNARLAAQIAAAL
jgi:pseudouridine-5'-phosphate glycosidase